MNDGLSRYFSQIGRKGGLSRAKRLTAARRKEIAIKASREAAKARIRKARKKRQKQAA